VLGMFLEEDPDGSRLLLPAPTDTEALAQTPGTFRLLPHADGTLLSDQPFFYLDNSRTFFVIPSWVTPSIRDWFDPAAVDPEFLLRLPEAYWRQPRALSPSIGPTDNPGGTASLAPASPVELDVAAVGAADLVAIRLDGLDGGAAPRTTAAAGVPTPAFTSFLRGTPTGTRPVLKFRAETRYQFLTHYHPYVCAFVRQLNQAGIDGLLQRKVQMAPWGFLPPLPSGVTPGPLDFETTYQPQQVSHPIVTQPYPRESVEFEYGGAYALYNWELFFHAPLLIADRLMKNQRFEEAQHWLHYIFKPTDTSSTDAIPNRYWQTKPFYQTAADDYPRQRIQQILQLLAAGGDPARRATLSPTEQAELDRQEKAIRDWREKPFQPHLVARLRTVAYQKTVVMKYLDNLIAWADQLFRRDTIESINEATQLYILAAELLGRRPHDVPPRAMPRVQTYNSLEPTLDEFSNALVQIEEFLSPSAGGVVAPGDQPTLSLPAMMYFCVPQNQKLLGYWDTVADRLFKIRHCMNIEGVVRQLPLFEPPIDPGLLVRATAAGVDLSSVLNDASAVQPHYRFQVLAQKASELCAELKSLGSVFLATLEKRDAEELALLRAQHESTMLKLIEQVKQQQYDEAVANQQALRASRQVAAARYLHYQQLLGVQSPQVPGEGQPVPLQAPSALASIMDVAGVKMIPFEAAELASLTASHMFQSIASGDDVAASIAHAIPNFNLEFWGLGTTYGGSNVGAAISAFSGFHKAIASQFGFAATMSSKLAQYVMRAHEWTLQSNLAAREIMQIDRQLTAAEIRRQIAQKELDNQRTQIDHAKQVEAFLRDKYTNQELYGWMLGQVSGVYFQSYQLAYDVAKRAELAYRHELGLTDSSFVQFGYWDSLKKGLLAGERLYHDVKRMEVAYLDHNRREYEITKHVSVSQLDPLALLQLKQRGECQVRIPEALFDLDYPGHFMRRLKSVSVTIPCVTGPYTSVNCTLTLLKSSVRHASTLLGGKYARDLDNDDPRFTGSSGAIQVIVTSDARNDSGLFEPNLRDDRYLPFEGAGAISEWHLELPSDFRAFDYDTVSDVVLHLRYTARAAGGALKQQAATELRTAIDELLRTEGHGLARPFSLRHEFPSEWHRFLNPSDGAAPQALTVALTKDRFPYLFQARTITIQDIELFVKIKPDFRATHNESELRLSLQPGAVASTTPLQGRLMPWNGLLHTKAPASALGEWTLAAWLGDQPQRLDPAAVEDIVLVCNYACS
jgi:Tc toxin complex TcA C-terminal TcB-binding domain